MRIDNIIYKDTTRTLNFVDGELYLFEFNSKKMIGLVSDYHVSVDFGHKLPYISDLATGRMYNCSEVTLISHMKVTNFTLEEE